MLYVADGRDRAAIDGYFEAVGEEGCVLIEMVAMPGPRGPGDRGRGQARPFGLSDLAARASPRATGRGGGGVDRRGQEPWEISRLAAAPDFPFDPNLLRHVSPIEWKNVVLYGEIKIDPAKLKVRGPSSESS